MNKPQTDSTANKESANYKKNTWHAPVLKVLGTDLTTTGKTGTNTDGFGASFPTSV